MRKLFIAVVCLLLCLSLSFGALAASNPFTDVPDNAWYAGYVKEAYENGWISGTSATRFSPNEVMTRGMIAVILWRLEGEPAPAAGISAEEFYDLPENAWYAKAALWAHAAGILTGAGEPTAAAAGKLMWFFPERKVDRADLAYILRLYARYRGAAYIPLDELWAYDLSAFADGEGLDYVTHVSCAWAVQAGVLCGNTRNGKRYLDPEAYTTRAQFVALLTRFLDKY